MKRKFFTIAGLAFLSLGGGCAGIRSAPASPETSAVPARTSPGPAAGGGDSVPDIAQREVIRRQEMIRQMDEAAIRASQRMAEDDLEGAVEGYRRAIGQ